MLQEVAAVGVVTRLDFPELAILFDARVAREASSPFRRLGRQGRSGKWDEHLLVVRALDNYTARRAQWFTE